MVVIGSTQKNAYVGFGDVSPTLTEAMGMGGGQIPMIVKELGFMDNGTGKHQSNTVYSTEGVSPIITTVNGGGTQQIKILEEPVSVASRGRSPDNPSDRRAGIHLEQRLEINPTGVSNCISTVAKDGWVLTQEERNKNMDQNLGYGIRKLTPKECWRLMDFTDEDYERAANVNSSTQLYKQAGNSIVKNVMVGIFGQMFEGKEDVYKSTVAPAPKT